QKGGRGHRCPQIVLGGCRRQAGPETPAGWSPLPLVPITRATWLPILAILGRTRPRRAGPSTRPWARCSPANRNVTSTDPGSRIPPVV
ncbi:MAG: hypothetical protein ACRDZY_17215, partial [Acidimicrobiales bacterium]